MSKKRVLIAVRLAALVALCLLHAADPAAAERDREREAMVREQIIARGVHDPVTLAALRQVPRICSSRRAVPGPPMMTDRYPSATARPSPNRLSLLT